jgi:hypothetical protein
MFTFLAVVNLPGRPVSFMAMKTLIAALQKLDFF